MQTFLRTLMLFFLIEIVVSSAKSSSSSAESEAHKMCAHFVANVIVYVPNSFPNNIEHQAIYHRYKREHFDYYVSSKQAEKQFSGSGTSSSRGEVSDRFRTPRSKRGFDLTPFLTKIQQEAFRQSDLVSKYASAQYLRVAFLLNRMVSLEENYNDIAYFVDHTIDSSFYAVRHTLWEPCWKKKYTNRGEIALGKGEKVEIEEVKQYYQNLHQENPEKAAAFLYYNEHTFLNSSVPYNALRQKLLNSSITSSFIQDFRKRSPGQPVYLAFLDDDTKSFCTKNKGTLTCYQKCIESFYENNHQFPVCLTSGYTISWAQNPFIFLGVSLDLEVRRAMGNIFSLAPYYPEPNTMIYIPEDHPTLSESFRKDNESSPLEMPTLIKDIVSKRYNDSVAEASNDCLFLKEGEIETTMPLRFLKNRTPNAYGEKKNKTFPELTLEGFRSLSVENIKDIRSIPQSHLWPNDWSGYVQDFLQENQREEITVAHHRIPQKNHKNFIKSIIASVYTYYSPIDRFIKLSRGNENYEDFIGFFSAVMEDFSAFLSLHVTFTYGTNYKSASKSGISHALRNMSSLPQYENLLNDVYTIECGKKIIQCAEDCGRSEIKVVRDYVQRTHVSSPLKPVTVKKEEINEPSDALFHPKKLSKKKLKREEEKISERDFKSSSSYDIKELSNEEAREYLIDLEKDKTRKEIALALDAAYSTLNDFLKRKTKTSPTIVAKLNEKIKEEGGLFKVESL